MNYPFIFGARGGGGNLNDLTINISVAVSAVSATFTVAAITAGSITAVNAGGLGSFVIKKNGE